MSVYNTAYYSCVLGNTAEHVYCALRMKPLSCVDVSVVNCVIAMCSVTVVNYIS
jgi:hypothetical protein